MKFRILILLDILRTKQYSSGQLKLKEEAVVKNCN